MKNHSPKNLLPIAFALILLTSCEKPMVCGFEELPPKVDPCTLTPDPGPCEAMIEKAFYNPQTGQCETFYWGGCGGTVPFETLVECRQQCGS
ncbi:MAG: hypothetical protein H6581_15690 [Bacteroidia bacterium]|nr:hypothetical protein [Bacteroidia bacterium]